MTSGRVVDLRGLEGRRVSLALVDGTRFDECQHQWAGMASNDLGLSNGRDRFVAVAEVTDVWETLPERRRRAA